MAHRGDVGEGGEDCKGGYVIYCSCPGTTSAGCQRCGTGAFKNQFMPGTFSNSPAIDPDKARLASLEERCANLDKEIAHCAVVNRKVEGALMEQQRMYEEVLVTLDAERLYYAKRIDELQALMKRLLEGVH